MELVVSMVLNAKSGNASLMKEIFDRIDGPVTQKVEAEHNVVWYAVDTSPDLIGSKRFAETDETA